MEQSLLGLMLGPPGVGGHRGSWSLGEKAIGDVPTLLGGGGWAPPVV